ncbi:hypothetical protein [Actinoplanes aureus]|uniref:Uncharacterized protein n=1 Tax=Actinoplanes aureus TaxID=2792083 RepID=A0A931FZ76_9ACTN|nr:hypothetical protein [Actinoplanes aureus]MBG0565378.1 hypothetical protein [Actinoplanes aureus]
MRLGDLLSKAPAKEEAQVEGFLNGRGLSWGQHKTIDAGQVFLNFLCKTCGVVRTFMSGKKLSCLGVGDRVVSIDACLKCLACESIVEAWFLVVSRNELHAQAPIVRLERYVDNRRDRASRIGVGAGGFDDLLERAQVAYEEQLGAGAMIYLRKIFEALTNQVAAVAQISTTENNGHRKSFRKLLKEVDEEHHIIPLAFSSDGYKLFSELSEIVHGDSSEEVALLKYEPCRSLVTGIIRNVANDQEMKRAIKELGWNVTALDMPSNGETAS